jgi:tetratricopeptide (TPR) repeat protein
MEIIKCLKSISQAVELAPIIRVPFQSWDKRRNDQDTAQNNALDSAIQTFKVLAKVMPNNADAWNHIGICYKEMRQTEESKFYFDRAKDIRLWKKDTPIIPKRDI